jgi:hypothetical protein
MCITCDSFLDLSGSRGNSFVYMFNHFDMTSNNGIAHTPRSLVHGHLSKHMVATNLESLNFYISMLGWFNDKRYNIYDPNMCFTYICKLGFNSYSWNIVNYMLSYYAQYLCKPLNVKHMGRVKMDDIYIYHVHTLSLLLACFIE